MNHDNELINNYTMIAKLTKSELYKNFKTSESGLSSDTARKRVIEYGKNIAFKEKKRSWLYFLINSFKDQFIIILLFLAIINFSLGDAFGSLIIVIIALISALIRFYQDYNTYLFNQKLKSKIFNTSMVLRDNKEVKIKTEDITLGDIIKLNAGAVIPADVIILENKDLFINQSTFTGESVPVEKTSNFEDSNSLFDISNIAFSESNVISGSATAMVFKIGSDTYLGHMGKEISIKHEPNNFEVGMKNVTKLLIRYMVFVCFFVLIIDGIIKHNFNEAILFALSVAVGITPSMLPMIVNVNLTKGSKILAKKKTLVKKIESIQNLGAMDILCTDKTGTLTENKIVLQKYVDILGHDDLNIVKDAYLNSYFGTGMKNIVDRAIIAYSKTSKIDSIINEYQKIDEIPFDYNRRRMSIVVKKDKEYKMITKGALEEIIKCCNQVYLNNHYVKLTDKYIESATKLANSLASEGMQVIALATKNEYPGMNKFSIDNEQDMILVGLIAFLDPPKKGVKEILNKLYSVGVSTKILTGDNGYATESICNMIGLHNEKILSGTEIEKMSDIKLKKLIEQTDVFVRLNPLQKERIVRLFKELGHVVGFMGDGVNDAPSLNQADVGISVSSATDIAKSSSDIILLERSLNVIYDAVMEGRKVYGNIIKYMKMALSADYGDVFSIMIASIFLPFLPLLPIQMLFQDFIYDFSQIGIPYDNVDMEFLMKPRKWNTKDLSIFMQIMGITSSLVDVLSFLIFWFILKYNSVDMQNYFQTAWFVTCLITELMIIINVRTSKKPFIESNPSNQLAYLTVFSMILTLITPILLCHVESFHFVILPLRYYFYLAALVLLYFIIVSVIKKIYIKKYKEWL